MEKLVGNQLQDKAKLGKKMEKNLKSKILTLFFRESYNVKVAYAIIYFLASRGFADVWGLIEH